MSLVPNIKCTWEEYAEQTGELTPSTAGGQDEQDAKSEQHDEHREQHEADLKTEPVASLAARPAVALSWPLEEGQCLPPSDVCIERVNLHAWEGMTRADVKALVKARGHVLASVKELSFTGQWGMALLDALLFLLPFLPALETLVLDGCKLRDAGAMALIHMLAFEVPLPCLSSLSLAHNGLGFKGLRALASLLPRLCHVDLRGNLSRPADLRAFWRLAACHTDQLRLDTYPMPQPPKASFVPDCVQARAAHVEQARLYKQAFAVGPSAKAGRGKGKGHRK